MSSTLLGALGAVATLVACGLHRPHPWRVAGLAGAEPAVAGPRRPRPPIRSGRRRGRRARSTDDAGVVACIDLVNLAISSGRTVHDAVGVAARLGTGDAAAAFAAVSRRVDAGHSMLVALEELDRRLGPGAAPLRAALSATVRSGAPAGPLLARLAERERSRSRRRAEERVRRLPVLLLGPLVVLVLPSFVVLTVVPVGLTTARAARSVIDQDLPDRGGDPSPSTATRQGSPP